MRSLEIIVVYDSLIKVLQGVYIEKQKNSLKYLCKRSLFYSILLVTKRKIIIQNFSTFTSGILELFLIWYAFHVR